MRTDAGAPPATCSFAFSSDDENSVPDAEKFRRTDAIVTARFVRRQKYLTKSSQTSCRHIPPPGLHRLTNTFVHITNGFAARGFPRNLMWYPDMPSSISFVTLLPQAIRDTALTVAGLHARKFPQEGYAAFRSRCEAQVDALSQELRDAGHTDDVIDDALYAQCALLDEAISRCTKIEYRDLWERQQLQSTRFDSDDAGEELIRRMQVRLGSAQPDMTLLLIFHTVLLLGFRGKFADEGETERFRLMTELTERIEGKAQKRTPDNAGDAGAATVVTPGAPFRWEGVLSPLVWATLVTLMAALVYGGLKYWLALSISLLSKG